MSVPAIGMCGDVHYLDGRLVRLEQELAACRAAGNDFIELSIDGLDVMIRVRPEDVSMAGAGVPGEVCMVEPMGRDDLLDVRIDGQRLNVLIAPGSRPQMGDTVRLSDNASKIQLFDAQSQQSLLLAPTS